MEIDKLTGHKMFSLLRSEQIAKISDASEEISYTAGDIVYLQGDKADYFFILLEGQVALHLKEKGGVNLLIDESTAGEVFGSCICFHIDAYTLTARCTGDSRVLKIRADVLKKVFEEDLALGYSVQSFISQTYFKRYIATMHKLQAIVQTIPLEAN